MTITAIPNHQWKYLLIDEDGSISGTDSSKVAMQWAAGNDTVIEVATCQLIEAGASEGINIREQSAFQFD